MFCFPGRLVIYLFMPKMTTIVNTEETKNIFS